MAMNGADMPNLSASGPPRSGPMPKAVKSETVKVPMKELSRPFGAMSPM